MPPPGSATTRTILSTFGTRVILGRQTTTSGTTFPSVASSNYPGAFKWRQSFPTARRGPMTSDLGSMCCRAEAGYSRPVIVPIDDPQELSSVRRLGPWT
jgi:hypothetical protein